MFCINVKFLKIMYCYYLSSLLSFGHPLKICFTHLTLSWSGLDLTSFEEVGSEKGECGEQREMAEGQPAVGVGSCSGCGCYEM